MDERNKDEEQGVKKKKYIVPEEIELGRVQPGI